MKICILSDKQWPSSDEAIRQAILALPFGDAEQERLLSIQNPTRAAQSLDALLALHALLRPLSYPICRTTAGKPFFDVPNAPHFSLSHTERLAVAAIADPEEGRIGIDFEWIRPISHDRIASRFFSPTELTCYENAPSPDTFFALWTAKEAEAKASGNGLFGDASQALQTAHAKHFYLKAEDRVGVLCVVTENPATVPTITLPPMFEILKK